ncbi:MAG: aminotransferase class V-fold PLP-dependent enzyme [Vicinamibacterales bacterium]
MPGTPSPASDFGPFGDRIWLNCSHQGPIPRVAAEAAGRAVAMKQSPFDLTKPGIFQEVPARLRGALGRLIGASPDDIVLGNSTSYGLQLVAQGLDWRAGDEVLVVEGDFPAVLFPWLVLRDRGVTIRSITPAGRRVEAADLARELRPETRVFCTTWVHSFRGHAVDAPALAAACRAHGTRFVLNASQGMGARVFDVEASGVDVVTSCGFKYLCGPYGTGFTWIRPSLRDRMRPTQAYWLANLTADDLAGEFRLDLKPDLGARAYDVYGTANFFNVMTWTASVEYLLSQGLAAIEMWDQALVGRLVEGLVARGWTLRSPVSGPERTTAVIFAGESEAATTRAFEALRARGIYGAMRQGHIRLSPHLYNTEQDIDVALEAIGRGD